jgi:hypothetical protein
VHLPQHLLRALGCRTLLPLQSAPLCFILILRTQPLQVSLILWLLFLLKPCCIWSVKHAVRLVQVEQLTKVAKQAVGSLQEEWSTAKQQCRGHSVDGQWCWPVKHAVRLVQVQQLAKVAKQAIGSLQERLSTAKHQHCRPVS